VAGGAAGGIIGLSPKPGSVERKHMLTPKEYAAAERWSPPRVPDRDRARYESIMDRQAVDIHERAATYRQGGWNKFDESAPPYRKEHELSASELERENAQLRRLVADLALENQALKDNVTSRRP
jgi:hypothetical protein